MKLLAQRAIQKEYLRNESQSLMHSLIALSRSESKTVIKDQNFSDNGERLERCSSSSYNLTSQSNVLAVANKNRVNDRLL